MYSTPIYRKGLNKLYLWNRKLEIEPRDLSTLTDKDLELFGYNNKHVRESMLQDFAMLPNQNEHFGRYNCLNWNPTLKLNLF